MWRVYSVIGGKLTSVMCSLGIGLNFTLLAKKDSAPSRDQIRWPSELRENVRNAERLRVFLISSNIG